MKRVLSGIAIAAIAIMGLAALLLWRGKLYTARPMLWVLMLAMPFPFIANSAGWMVTELGRQPWIIYGLMRTAEGTSAQVSSGNIWFTLLGFMGMYFLLGVLFLFLVAREVAHGPEVAPIPPGAAQGLSA